MLAAPCSEAALHLSTPLWPTAVDLSDRKSVCAVLVSDTHGHLDPRIVRLIEDSDLAVHAGDVGSEDVLIALQRAPVSVVVGGNNDVPSQWTGPMLPPEASIALPGGTLVVEHGHRRTPARDRHAILRRRHQTARAVLYGHSHQLTVDDDASPTIFNPGASGRVRTFGGPSCILLQVSAAVWTTEIRRFPIENLAP